MAKSTINIDDDNYDDLNELDNENEIIIDDSLTRKFNRAANHLQTLLPNVSSDILLTLYGYYKQGSQGPCTAPKPSWYDVKAKSKWHAWNQLGTLPKSDAKTRYIETISRLDPNFNINIDDIKDMSWVSVSIMQKTDEPTSDDSDKTLVDYIKEGNPLKVEECLKTQFDLSAIINDVNDDDGLGLIHWAADRGFVDVLRVLLRYGADVDLQDCDGQTALHYASSCGHVDCVRFLLDNKASKDVIDGNGDRAATLASDNAIKELLIC